MLARALSALALTALASHVRATPTSFSDAQMRAWLADSSVDLANAYAPLYFFGQALDQPPCIPDWAFGGNPDQNDTFAVANVTPPAAQCQYPDVGCGCRQPGVATGNQLPTSSAFPVYYSMVRCNATEVRVAYNLFYQKDGAEVGFIQTGHNWDWERNIVVHTKDSSDNWSPTTLLASAHSSYNTYKWGDIQNTLTTEQIRAGDAKTPNGVRGNDHPKVYIAWSKHPSFDDRDTAFNDPISQSLGDAFRSDDWWYYVDPMYYVQSDNSTEAGQVMLQINWGSADSDPPLVHSKMCTEGS